MVSPRHDFLRVVAGLAALMSVMFVWTSGQASASASTSTTTFDVSGGNMEPALQIGERVTVNRIAYRHHRVRPGDIIVFASPPTENCGGSFDGDLIARDLPRATRTQVQP